MSLVPHQILISECVVWRKKGRAGETEIKQMEGAKEIEAPILIRKSLSSKGRGQVGTTRKEWVRVIPLKMQ